MLTGERAYAASRYPWSRLHQKGRCARLPSVIGRTGHGTVMRTKYTSVCPLSDGHRISKEEGMGEDRHADSRDEKRRKGRYGMRVSGRSIKSVLLPLIAKKATEAKEGKK